MTAKTAEEAEIKANKEEIRNQKRKEPVRLDRELKIAEERKNEKLIQKMYEPKE